MKKYEEYYLNKRNRLTDASLRHRITGKLDKNSRIHISAVCGKAMASIACMLSEAGYKITGSDPSFHPPMSDVLTAHHIECHPPSTDNVRDIDLFIPGNMLPPTDLEVTTAREHNMPMMSGAEVCCALLVPGKRSLVVAGTHGKTTSSSLLAHIFMNAGRDPAYLIGGVFQDSGASYSSGGASSTHVIFEGDEYDCAYFDKAPKFLRYSPTSAIITSIEHDHIDLYPTFEDYVQAFQFLAEEIPTDGYLIMHESTIKLLDTSHIRGKLLVYGSSDSSDIVYKIESTNSSGTIFSLRFNNKNISDIHTPLFGEYNVANASAVFVLAVLEGLAVEDVMKGCATYPGVCERQEVLGEGRGITVIRDFAHHPTAVEATLYGLRMQYPTRRIICVFEARSITSRRKLFEAQYPQSLSPADISIVVAPPFKAHDDQKNIMDISKVKESLEKAGHNAFTAHHPADVLPILADTAKSGDVIVFMSNGDFEGLPHTFLHTLF